jgi:hypothetical protein
VLKKFNKFLCGQFDSKGKPIKVIEETKNIKMDPDSISDQRKTLIPEILRYALIWIADGLPIED